MAPDLADAVAFPHSSSSASSNSPVSHGADRSSPRCVLPGKGPASSSSAIATGPPAQAKARCRRGKDHLGDARVPQSHGPVGHVPVGAQAVPAGCAVYRPHNRCYGAGMWPCRLVVRGDRNRVCGRIGALKDGHRAGVKWEIVEPAIGPPHRRMHLELGRYGASDGAVARGDPCPRV